MPRDLNEELVSDLSAVSVRRSRTCATRCGEPAPLRCQAAGAAAGAAGVLQAVRSGSLGPTLLPLLAFAPLPARFVVGLLSLSQADGAGARILR